MDIHFEHLLEIVNVIEVWALCRPLQNLGISIDALNDYLVEKPSADIRTDNEQISTFCLSKYHNFLFSGHHGPKQGSLWLRSVGSVLLGFNARPFQTHPTFRWPNSYILLSSDHRQNNGKNCWETPFDSKGLAFLTTTVIPGRRCNSRRVAVDRNKKTNCTVRSLALLLFCDAWAQWLLGQPETHLAWAWKSASHSLLQVCTLPAGHTCYVGLSIFYLAQLLDHSVFPIWSIWFSFQQTGKKWQVYL